MVDNLSSIRSKGSEEPYRPSRNRPLGQPRNDSFKKITRKEERRPSKEEEELGVEERETNSPPSLFELSKNAKNKSLLAKGKPPPTRSPFELASNRPTPPLDQELPSLAEEMQASNPSLTDTEAESLVNADEEMVNLPQTEENIEDSLLKHSLIKKQMHKSNEPLAMNQRAQSKEGQAIDQKGRSINPEEAEFMTQTEDSTPLIEEHPYIFDEEPEEPQLKDSLKTPAGVDRQAQERVKKSATNDQVPANEFNRQQAAILHSQKAKSSKEATSFEGETKTQGFKKTKGKSEAGSRTEDVSEEKAKLGVNASIQAAQLNTDTNKASLQESQQASRSATIRELAAQLIERIQVMRQEDRTETMITLRHPPILEGATVRLTAFDHAKREFNISFASLSPEAKLFLDRKLKEDSLTETLERKGIIVHIVKTTTQADNLINLEAGQTARDQEQSRQQQQEQQQRAFQEQEREGEREE